jgi:hypothetical protein
MAGLSAFFQLPCAKFIRKKKESMSQGQLFVKRAKNIVGFK